MWLTTKIGFFSIVEKPEDRPLKTLTIRARVKGDLEALREYLPGIGEINSKAGTDYPYRVRVTRVDFAAAMVKIALDIDYKNFKDEVAKRQGKARAAIYSKVWTCLLALQGENKTAASPATLRVVTAKAKTAGKAAPKPSGPVIHPKPGEKGELVKIKIPSTASDPATWMDGKAVACWTPGSPVPAELFGVSLQEWQGPESIADWNSQPGQKPSIDDKFKFEPAPGKKVGAAALILEDDLRIWLIKPTNEFAGNHYTFPKGTVDAGMSMQAAAIKEAHEETGLRIEIVGILGDFERSTSKARYYIAQRIGGTPADMGWESQAVCLVPFADAVAMLNNPVDLEILDCLYDEINLGKAEVIPPLLASKVVSFPSADEKYQPGDTEFGERAHEATITAAEPEWRPDDISEAEWNTYGPDKKAFLELFMRENTTPLTDFDLSTEKGRFDFLWRFSEKDEEAMFEAVQAVWGKLNEPKAYWCGRMAMAAGLEGTGKKALKSVLEKFLVDFNSIDIAPLAKREDFASLDEWHAAVSGSFGDEIAAAERITERYAKILDGRLSDEVRKSAKVVRGPWRRAAWLNSIPVVSGLVMEFAADTMRSYGDINGESWTFDKFMSRLGGKCRDMNAVFSGKPLPPGMEFKRSKWNTPDQVGGFVAIRYHIEDTLDQVVGAAFMIFAKDILTNLQANKGAPPEEWVWKVEADAQILTHALLGLPDDLEDAEGQGESPTDA